MNKLLILLRLRNDKPENNRHSRNSEKHLNQGALTNLGIDGGNFFLNFIFANQIGQHPTSASDGAIIKRLLDAAISERRHALSSIPEIFLNLFIGKTRVELGFSDCGQKIGAARKPA